MSALQRNLIRSKLPVVGSGRVAKKGTTKDYSPVPWTKYFDKYEDVTIQNDVFRVYIKGDKGPVLFLLHGGGLSSLGWSLFAESITNLVECRIYAIDLRGHGSTKTTNDEDLSAEKLSSDIGLVLSSLFPEDPPPIFLMGHSMGGAMAVHVAARHLVKNLVGLGVIDVVEGTAMEALSSMQSFLRGRPKGFSSISNAIEWCCATGMLAINDIGKEELTDVPLSNVNPDKIVEEESDEREEESSSFKLPSISLELSHKYTWRIDLTKSEKHWRGWFSGMSRLFLSLDEPKLLILAGIDTLDKELTIGQMQGRFQFHVLPKCGHAVHEDVPDRVADLIASFLVRYKLAEATAHFVRPLPAC